MSESNIEHSDLCSTCANAPDCAFLKNKKKAVFQCEEFEIAGRDGEQRPPKAASRTVASAQRNDEADKLIGLCCNCENRATCVFPKPEGGVWHCEEYA